MSVERARARAEKIGLKLQYGADLGLLAACEAPFTQLALDEHAAEYVLASEQFRHGTCLTWLHRILRGFLSDFDINGILGTYPMHVLSTAQWRVLVETALGALPNSRSLFDSETTRSLLDVGAGRGDATDELAPLFQSVTVTETSSHMARRLRKRGYNCVNEDISKSNKFSESFDVVSLLNVLDRCDFPMSLLATARRALKPGGLLLIALVLPYRPFVYDQSQPRSPLERLAIKAGQFEIAATEFVTACLLPLGLEVLTLSRTPYFSGGDAQHPLYELDDLIVVCRAKGELVLIGEKSDD